MVETNRGERSESGLKPTCNLIQRRFSNFFRCLPGANHYFVSLLEEELMTPEHKAEMAKIRETATASALEVVKVIMPRKVIELTELIQVRTTHWRAILGERRSRKRAVADFVFFWKEKCPKLDWWESSEVVVSGKAEN